MCHQKKTCLTILSLTSVQWAHKKKCLKQSSKAQKHTQSSNQRTLLRGSQGLSSTHHQHHLWKTTGNSPSLPQCAVPGDVTVLCADNSRRGSSEDEHEEVRLTWRDREYIQKTLYIFSRSPQLLPSTSKRLSCCMCVTVLTLVVQQEVRLLVCCKLGMQVSQCISFASS